MLAAHQARVFKAKEDVFMSSPSASQVAIFSDVSLRELALHGQTRSYPRGAVIISEGDVGDSLFMILAGRVKVYVADEDGREMILDTRGAGDYVGEMTLDGGPRSASVMSLEPTVFSVITRTVLREALRTNPDLALSLIATLVGRARLATSLVKDLALLDVYGRVARLLLQLATEQEDGVWIVPERLTQQDIADRVGASRDMVNRIFKDLATGGYVTVENRQIKLHRKPPARW